MSVLSIARSKKEEFLELIGDTKIGQTLNRELDELKWKRRQVYVDALAQIGPALSAAMDRRDRTVEPLRAAALSAKLKWEASEAKVLAAQTAGYNEVFTLRSKQTQLENSLRASADVKILEARREMETRWDRGRSGVGRSRDVETGSVNDKRQPIMKTLGNGPAIQRLLGAMREARLAFEALQLQNPPDIDGAIAAILAPVEMAWAQIETIEDDGPRAA